MVTLESDVMPLKDAHLVSPELALIDPDLARVATMALPDRFKQRVVPHAAFAPTYLVKPPAAVPLASARSWWRPGSRAALAFAGAMTVVVLLLADVRVEVGRKEAAAEPPTTTTPSPSTQPSGTGAKASSPAQQPRAPRVVTKRHTRTQAAQPQERRLAWAPVPGVDGYRVELFRGPDRVFVRDTTRPDVTVPGTWTFEHARESLRPGEYRWIVWSVTAGLRSIQAIVQSKLVVESG
jgi:hypothetical protein